MTSDHAMTSALSRRVAAVTLLTAALVASGCSGGGGNAGSSVYCSAEMLPGDLVISEILADGAPPGGDEGKEWFELYNASGQTLDLAGLSIVYANGSTKTYVVPQKLELGAAEYLVLGNAIDEAMPEYMDWGYGDGLGNLTNGGGTLTLYCASTEVDRATYPEAKAGYAYAFDGAKTPHHTDNDDPENWCLADNPFAEGSFGTPGERNDPCTTPVPNGLVITEIMNSSALGSDWMEIYNPTDHDLYLKGCIVGETGDSAHHDEIDAKLVLGPGEYGLLAERPDKLESCELPENLFDYGGVSFTGGPEEGYVACPWADAPAEAPTIEVEEGDSTATYYIMDMITYDSDANGVSKGVSWSLCPRAGFDTTANDDPSNWIATESKDAFCTIGEGDAAETDYGTPGQANPECPPPPVLPLPGEVVITEIMGKPVLGSEWLEMASAADHKVDLDTCIIGETGGTEHHYKLGGRISLEPGDYTLMASAPDKIAACLPYYDVDYSSLSFVSTSAEDAYLACPLETVPDGADTKAFDDVVYTVIDQITYNFSSLGVDKGQSWSLCPRVGLDAEANDDPKNWMASDESYCFQAPADGEPEVDEYGTPGEVNQECPPPPVHPLEGEAVITEIMANPEFGTDWIEVHNATDHNIDLNGCAIGETGSTPHHDIIDETFSLDPGEDGLLMASPAKLEGCGLTADTFDFSSLSLVSSSDEEAYIACPQTDPPVAGTARTLDDVEYYEVDIVAYNFSLLGVPKGSSWSLCPGMSAADNDIAANWRVAFKDYCTVDLDGVPTTEFGTPGAENSPCN